MSENRHTDEVNQSVDYERRDVKVFYLAMVAILMIVAAVVIHAAVWRIFERFSEDVAAGKSQKVSLIRGGPRPPPEPRLQADPALDLERMRDSERAVLQNYRWIDRQKGIVGIPVERAMNLIAEKGLPSFQQSTDAVKNANAEPSIRIKNGRHK